MHAAERICCSEWARRIVPVLLLCHFTQIFEPIIVSITVNVIKPIRGPPTLLMKPNDPMNVIHSSVNTNRQIAFTRTAFETNDITRSSIRTDGFLANERASSRIIVKQVTYLVRMKELFITKELEF